MIKKHISFILSIILILSTITVIPTVSAKTTEDIADTGANVELAETGWTIPSETTFATRLAQLKKKYYPSGYSGAYYEDGYAMAWQCYGFACQMLYDVFGIKYYADGFVNKADYNMGNIYAGDIVRIRGNSHSIFVTRVTSTGYYICDGNWDYNNGVRWDAFYTKAEMAATFTYKIHVPGSYLTGNAVAKAGLYAQTPALRSAACTGSGIDVSWNQVKDAYAYRVFCKAGTETSWRAVGKTKATTFTYNKDLVYGKKYTFTVRAVDSYGEFISDYNKTGISTDYRVAPPEMKSVKATAGKIRVTWAASKGVSLYRVYYRTEDDKKWHSGAVINGTAYNFTKGTPYTTYRFTVVCLNAKKQAISGSSASNLSARFFTTGTQLDIPTNVVPAPYSQQGAIKVTWNAVPNATRYHVFVSRNGSMTGWKKIGSTTKNYFIHKGCANGGLYRYTVRCVDNKGKYVSGYKAGVSLQYFDYPTKLKAVKQDDNGNIKLTWNAIKNAPAYVVFYRTENDKSWTRIKSAIRTNSYVFPDAQDGEKYTFTVRVCTTKFKYLSYFLSAGVSLTYTLPVPETEPMTAEPTVGGLDPTVEPTDAPTDAPSEAPTDAPPAENPTNAPGQSPTSEPETTAPTNSIE